MPVISSIAVVCVFPSTTSDSVAISFNFLVLSLIVSSFLVIGDKLSANFKSWVCFEILFLSLRELVELSVAPLFYVDLSDLVRIQ